MQIADMIRDLEDQIEKLQRAKKSLEEVEAPGSAKAAPNTGRQAGLSIKLSDRPVNKRRLSEEGKKRIGEAARRRWAEKRKEKVSTKGKTSVPEIKLSK